MLKTNFTKSPEKRWALFCLLLLMMSSGKVYAQAIACNNSVQVSVDNTPNVCQAEITADMILEGDPIPGHDYLIEITHNLNVIVTGTNQVTITGASQYFGSTLTAKITDLVTQNSCWGSMHLEDKLAPVLTCPDVTVNCSENLNNVPTPTALDNCDLNPAVQLNGENVSASNICANGYATIERTYVGVDDEGNVSQPCVQTIYVQRPSQVDFPNDIIWHCEQYDDYPNIVAAQPLNPQISDTDLATPNVIDVAANLSPSVLNNTGSGVVANVIGTYCNYQQSHHDQVLNTCGNSIKILRTWTVFDWCTNSVVTSGVNGEDNVQVIKVSDRVAPVIQRAPFSVSANVPGQHPQPCRSQGFLLPPTQLSDNCNTIEVKIYTPVGEANYVNGGGANGGLIPAPGLPKGVHIVTYQVTDACGNQINLDVQVTVIDDVVPIAICDEITDVNLGTDGRAVVYADVFDDGSYDNCCLSGFEVRRMEDPCDDGHNDLVFGPSIVFCCEDLTEPVTVVFRAIDCDNNANECMVTVNVNDKIAPVLLNCPANERVSCDWYTDNLELQLENAPTEQEQCDILSNYFGTASFYDNCAVVMACDVFVNVDQCLEGNIRRTWAAQDEAIPPNQATQVCVQNIQVDHISDWVVEFPADITVNCGTTVPEFEEPEIFYETCELVAVSYEDEIFTTVADACYKIVRDWTIINWCVVGDNIDQEVVEVPENQLGLVFPLCDLDGDGDCDDRTFRDSWNATARPNANIAFQIQGPDTDLDSDPWDGYIVYEQVIKVIDTVDPVFVNDCADLPEVCIAGNTCGVDLVLPTPAIDECSPEVTVLAEIKFGNTWFDGFGPYNDVAPGTYEVRYTASDNCNNQSACETTLTIVDCKKPTPYCKNGIIVELMVPVDPNDDPMVTVWASDLNAGSFDNCPGTLQFSFSPLVGDDNRVYTCADVDQVPVEIWVTDATGNQDYCETFIIIQANMGQCGNSPLVAAAGAIQDENDDSVEEVTISLTGQSTGSMMSNNDGLFNFSSIPVGNDITITPEKDDDDMNGVTTFDLVLISKHVLGVQLLDSPLKLLAADANNTGSVTTADIVELRKLILQIITKFSNNTSWRFVDKDYVFPNANNPWEEVFPEVININNIAASVLDADFIAIKIGDVNSSAVTNLASAGGDDRSGNAMTISTTEQEIVAGQLYNLDFSIDNPSVLAYQFTLNFAKNKLRLTELVPGIAKTENFGFALLDEGALTASWNQPVTGDRQVGKEHFSITFEALENGVLSEMLQVNSRFTRAEAYDLQGEPMSVELVFAGGDEAAGFALYQNTPNPFNGQTMIGFNLPEAGKARLTLMDVTGKVIYSSENEFSKGYHQIEINSNNLPSTGMLYYTLETAKESATRKMVIIE